MRTAVGIARAGGAVGRVGVPQEMTIPNAQPTFYGNITTASRDHRRHRADCGQSPV